MTNILIKSVVMAYIALSALCVGGALWDYFDGRYTRRAK